MRVVKVSSDSFFRMCNAIGKHCKFMKIPSSKEGYAFTGLLMADGVWVAWPQDLTDDENELYLSSYGSPPDIVTPGDSVNMLTYDQGQSNE